MPAPVPADPRSKRLLTALFWGGVALAPVAALILLVAEGNGPLRFAAVLAIMAVVLIGLSIALRTEGGAGHADELREELDELRRELRGEIVAAAQRGNQALDEAQRVQEALAGLRRQVDAGGAGPVAGGESPGAGRARVAAPEPETPPGYAERPAGPAGVYAAAPAGGHGAGPGGEYEDEQPGIGYAAGRPPTGHAGDRPVSGSAGVYGSGGRPEQDNRSGDPAPRPLGVVRHTETVHVTTRQTIVDGGVGESGSRYGGYAAPRSDSRSERPWPGQRETWSAPRDDHDAYRDDRAAHRDDRDWGAPRDEPGWDDGGQQWDAPAEPASPGRRQRPDDSGEYWAQMRAGDRWAAVRDDDQGRELRVGERRAEVHADPTGTEYRVADRWASVRRDEPRRAAEGDEGWREGWGEPEHRPALPAGGVPVPPEWRPPRQRGYQPEPAREYQPEPTYGYSPEPARGYPPEPPVRGYPPSEAARGPRPEHEPYGRRHHAEESGYGHSGHDGARNRWR
ncbi:hypothetical protein Vqi01_33560 [Micromonospora qiuiae]|uniref:Uncharacterized protein n=1 Tax=Micromonospora qiuiae TaxID=502268 RepID=A0ABQ4JDD7_9ACTN|nr:hypothetical protein [Micromonospora qiuiae]GIJ28194.1 hypothetical protein Vqi01_33560 [Micromonospora qiuiae]